MAKPSTTKSTSLKDIPVHAGFWRRIFQTGGLTVDIAEHCYKGDGTPERPFEVDFRPDDPWCALKFSRLWKNAITVNQSMATLAVSFVSTAYSSWIPYLTEEFDASTELSLAGLSLFITGFAVGPLLWGPLSEFQGRRDLFILTYAGLTIFCGATVAAQNIQTVIILRFLSGVLGSSPLVTSGAVISDLYTQKERGVKMALFSAAPFLGPCIGPIAGGFLGKAAGWRWIAGLMAIFSGVMWFLGLTLLPETYAPVILRRRAKRLTKLHGHEYVSALDVGKPKKTVGQALKTALGRPWMLLLHEPIVVASALYNAIIYGTLYMLFPAFPIVFEGARGWDAGIAGLAFCGVAVGIVIATSFIIFNSRRYARLIGENGGFAPPEARLPGVMIGAIAFPVGMFWFAWTNGPDIHWMVCILGSVVFGAGIVLIFQCMINYLVDVYVIYAASALAANALLRSLIGASFPLFTTQMYGNLGIHWGSSIPAFLGVACIPVPFLFYKYGKWIRSRGKFAAHAQQELERMLAAAHTSRATVLQEDDSTEEPSVDDKENSTRKSEV